MSYEEKAQERWDRKQQQAQTYWYQDFDGKPMRPSDRPLVTPNKRTSTNVDVLRAEVMKLQAAVERIERYATDLSKHIEALRRSHKDLAVELDDFKNEMDERRQDFDTQVRDIWEELEGMEE